MNVKLGYIVSYGMNQKLVTYNRALAYKVAEKKSGTVKVCTDKKIKNIIDKCI